jgi:TRAP-type C4-dicarboxylate transport system permease small subunit
MKIVDFIARITGLVAMGVLLLMMLLTVADVFLRATLSKPIIGTTEITEQMMVAVVFLGFGWCALQGKHVRVDLFVSRYSSGMQRVIDFIIHCVGLVLVAIICWRTFVTTLTVQRLGITCSYIGVPKFPFYALAAFGWAVLFVAMASLFVKSIKESAEK